MAKKEKNRKAAVTSEYTLKKKKIVLKVMKRTLKHDHFLPCSIEQMLAVNPGKTPISLLQEYGTRIGKTPVYDLLKAEGQAHQPNFTFRVSVGEISCTGQGPSKKAAKHKAAEAALKMLKGGLGAPAGFGVGVDSFVGVDVASDGDRSAHRRALFIIYIFFIAHINFHSIPVNVPVLA